MKHVRQSRTQWRQRGWVALVAVWALGPDGGALAEDGGLEPALEEKICGIVKTQAHPDRVALVREFVQRDGKGQFLRTDAWVNGAVSYPTAEPGPDNMTVIRGYKVKPPSRRARDEVRIEVEYDILGTFSQRFEPAPARSTRVFVAVRTPHGWRIQSLVLNQHVLVEACGCDVGPPAPADAATPPAKDRGSAP